MNVKKVTSLLLLMTILYHSGYTQEFNDPSRTEFKDDAGLMGTTSKSGFFQTYQPINFPAVASSWWHLLDVRHSNPMNNYTMQFAGSFFDQNLYFRKTNNNASQSWSRVLLQNSDGFLTNQNIKIYTDIGQSFFVGHQAGASYSFSDGIFRAITDNANGAQNYYYDGITNGQTNFSVRADGKGYFAGNVGIGTVSPSVRFHINNGDFSYGAILANASESSFSLYTKTITTQPVNIESFRLGLKYGTDENNGFISFYRGGSSEGGWLTFSTFGIERMRIDEYGNIGVGTISPTEKFSVNGNIRSKKLIVTQTGWSDYVFDSSYQLKPLTELEQFIKANKHLPDIPSAKEVEKGGIDVGENQALLLKKIEELTLYMIEMKKENFEIKKNYEMLNMKNDDQQKRIGELEKYLIKSTK